MNLFEIDNVWGFLFILPLVSFMYAAVGHGGASGYLALMALFGFLPEVMKPTALLLNIFVAAISFYHYQKTGNFKIKLFVIFAIASIPFAFLGGILEVNTSLYKNILGVLLIIAIIKMLYVFGKNDVIIKNVKIWQGLAIGGAIGFFSGLIGIGGGIILSPIILIMKWGNIKEAAAVSALFIWVNSVSGMAGQLSAGVKVESDAFILVGIAIIGGFLGGYLGSKKLNNKFLRYMLAIILAIASLKLILT